MKANNTVISRSDMLDITPPALMLAGVKELPLSLDLGIGFQFGIGFSLEDVVADVNLIEFVH